MISGIEWIPEGVADPEPKKYELSRVEKELLREQARVHNQQYEDGKEEEEEEEEELEDEVDDDDQEEDEDEASTSGMDASEATKETTNKSASEIIASKKVDISSLPADLRMDDYSEDDEDDNNGGARMGDLLLGSAASGGGIGIDEDGHMDALPDSDSAASMESEDDDDGMDDVPDTREYDPTDIEGLQSMAFSGNTRSSSANAPYDEFDNDDGSVSDYSDASNREDTNLRPGDALLLSAKTDAASEFSSLEVHLYERDTGNFFVHHDIPLPSYPLCLAHGTLALPTTDDGGRVGGGGGGAGNYVAVGTFEPGIEVWNLDILDALEPVCTLGGDDLRAEEEEWARKIISSENLNNNNNNNNNKTNKKKKKKKNKNNMVSYPPTSSSSKPRLRPHSHTDAVMSLSWNQNHRHVLASGSADKTVKLWDITRADDTNTGGHAATFTHHTDKVEAVAWHPTEGTLLASGGYDRKVAVIDARVSGGGGGNTTGNTTGNTHNNRGNNNGCKMTKLTADCEAIVWDPFRSHLLTAAGEDGVVCCWDVRKLEGSGCYWKFVAHEMGGCSDIAYNPKVPGMLATCAVDKTVALWDTLNATDQPDQTPVRCYSKEMNVGQLFSLSFYPSSTCLLATGGSGGEPALWDMEDESFFVERFKDRVGDSAGLVGGTMDGGAKDEEGPNYVEDFEAEMAKTKKMVEGDDGKGTKKKRKKKKKKPKVHRKGQ